MSGEQTPEEFGWIVLAVGMSVLFAGLLFIGIFFSDGSAGFEHRCDMKGGIVVSYHHAKSTDELCFRYKDRLLQ